MQAIHTKYVKPTSKRTSRVMATCEGGSVCLPWDHEFDTQYNHELAAALLCDLMNWLTDRLITGSLPDGSYCHVFAPRA